MSQTFSSLDECNVVSNVHLNPNFGFHPVMRVKLRSFLPVSQAGRMHKILSIILPLSNDLFADPYELARRENRNVVMYVEPHPDLEVPSNDVRAKGSVVFVQASLEANR